MVGHSETSSKLNAVLCKLVRSIYEGNWEIYPRRDVQPRHHGFVSFTPVAGDVWRQKLFWFEDQRKPLVVNTKEIYLHSETETSLHSL